MVRSVVVLILFFSHAVCYSPPFVTAGFMSSGRGLSLRGGQPNHPHVTACASSGEPVTKEAAQQSAPISIHDAACGRQRSFIQELSSGAKSRSAIPGLEKPEVEDQTPKNPLTKESKVLIVGASRGIGLEFVKQVLDKEASVVATFRGAAPPSSLVELQEKVGEKRLSFLEMDVADEKSIAAAADAFQKSEGFAPLTHILHSAGVYGPRVSLDGEARYGRPAGPPVTAADMMKVFEVNAVGPLLVAQQFLPLLRKPSAPSETAVIGILTSKVGSVDDNASGGAYAYRASKAALNVVAKSLMCDTHGAASVLLLHPGYVRTDMTDGQGLIDAQQSVKGMLRAVEATDADKEFRFVDYKACLIPW